jgi:hypothetical protein
MTMDEERLFDDAWDDVMKEGGCGQKGSPEFLRLRQQWLGLTLTQEVAEWIRRNALVRGSNTLPAGHTVSINGTMTPLTPPDADADDSPDECGQCRFDVLVRMEGERGWRQIGSSVTWKAAKGRQTWALLGATLCVVAIVPHGLAHGLRLANSEDRGGDGSDA